MTSSAVTNERPCAAANAWAALATAMVPRGLMPSRSSGSVRVEAVIVTMYASTAGAEVHGRRDLVHLLQVRGAHDGLEASSVVRPAVMLVTTWTS